MKILITGGAGFIGSHIAERELAAGHDVTIVDDLTTGAFDNVPLGATFLRYDIADGVPVGEWDLVYHCAASYADKDAWERDARTNVTGTVNVVREAARSGAFLVYFQTSLCYGIAPASPVRLDAPLAPVGSYAVSKTAGECYIRDAGIPYASFRLANVYGPRNLSGPPPQFFKRLAAGEECVVVDTRRDFVYVDDLVELVTTAAHGRVGGVYHAASGTDRSIEDVFDAVAEAMGVADAPVRRLARADDDAPTILLDPSHTEATFGWRPTTDFQTGIDRAVDWYREHGVRRTYTHLKGER